MAVDATGAKICSKCGSASNGFFTDKRSLDGLKHQCKKCHIGYADAWHKANPERTKEIAKASVRRNEEKVKARGTRYRLANKEKLYAARRRWLDANPETATRFAEALKVARKEWKLNNPEEVNAHTRLRRARKRGAEGVHTGKDIAALLESQGCACNICKADLSSTEYHVDHMVPLSRGGSNAVENLQILCWLCNTTKGAKTQAEFLHWVEQRRWLHG